MVLVMEMVEVSPKNLTEAGCQRKVDNCNPVIVWLRKENESVIANRSASMVEFAAADLKRNESHRFLLIITYAASNITREKRKHKIKAIPI